VPVAGLIKQATARKATQMSGFSLKYAMISDYYCQQKFDWVEVRLYDGFIASCCQAQPHRIKKDDIIDRPIGFFNYPEIIKEREMMLANEKVPGCESCWKFEENNLASRRTNCNSTKRIYNEIFGSPKTVNLVISNTCNQTCVYCCKNYSHTWLNDITNNGNYDLDGDVNRHQLNNQDRIMLRLKQSDLHQSALKKIILKQISECENIEHIIITGGEPFLDNFLIEIVDSFKTFKKLTIVTGLHVQPNRFVKLTNQLLDLDANDLWIKISGENTGDFHMFNRFGSDYGEWKENYQTVKSNFNYYFEPVISNLTLFGIFDFLQIHSNEIQSFHILSDPEYLMMNLLDDQSKYMIQKQLDRSKHPEIHKLINTMNSQANTSQKPNLRKYFHEFARRRQLDIGIFPSSFLKWLDN
jgi:organic radical activating enzyme